MAILDPRFPYTKQLIDAYEPHFKRLNMGDSFLVKCARKEIDAAEEYFKSASGVKGFDPKDDK